jgi:hypothetical protein
MNDFVPDRRKLFSSLAPNAGIEEQLHAVASATGGSTRSCATSR